MIRSEILRTDIIFCILVMPGMMFLFPTGEWLQWHTAYVLLYVLWLYAVYFIGRFGLGPLLVVKTWKRLVTAACILLLIWAVTFLMTLTTVDFPQDAARLGKMPPHETAMWVLLLAVLAYSLPVGMLSTRLRWLSRRADKEAVQEAAREALETRRAESGEMAGEELLVKSDYKTVHIPLSAIQYVEGRNNYSCFHLDNLDDVVTQLSLKSALEMLPQGKFARIHRSYIIPLWRIEKRTAAQVKLLGLPDPFPIGRAFKDQFKDGR